MDIKRHRSRTPELMCLFGTTASHATPLQPVGLRFWGVFKIEGWPPRRVNFVAGLYFAAVELLTLLCFGGGPGAAVLAEGPFAFEAFSFDYALQA